MMLAAVETVTKADPVWASRRHNSDVAAQATAGEAVHAASPLKSSGQNVYNEPRRASMKDAPAFSAAGFTASSKSTFDCACRILLSSMSRSIKTYPSSGYLFGKAWKINALPASLRPTGIGSKAGVHDALPTGPRRSHSATLEHFIDGYRKAGLPE